MQKWSLVGLSLSLPLLWGGCQLLPQQQVLCAQSSSCPAFVQQPFVLGQPDAQTDWIQGGFHAVSGLLMVGGRLLVADLGNNRILIWNSFPTKNNQPADMVLGEPNLGELTYNGPAAAQISGPAYLASSGSNLVVAADSGSFPRTMMFWNSFPTATYQPFDFAMNTSFGPPVTGHTFAGAAPFYIGGHLYAADRGFSRLLYWSSVPTMATDASAVIGQASLSSGSSANPGGIGPGTFSGPQGASASDGTTLFVPDTQNHRVLAFNPLPTMNGATASIVLGQQNTTSNTPNNGGPSFSTMNLPQGLAIGQSGAANYRLAVADRGNHRVLLWNSLPSSNGLAANLALGQPNGSSIASNYNGVSAASLNSPAAVVTDGTRLAVSDNGNSRVLLWNSWPTSSGTPADLVLGQPSMTNRGTNGEFPTAQRLMAPTSITHAGSRFIVADADGNRVLIWSQFPTDPSATPALVLGQPDFNSSGSNPNGVTATSFSNPLSVSSDGNVLAVADYYNNRVLLWNSIPTQNQQKADVVLGQASMMAGNSNSPSIALGLNQPQSVCVTGGRLYVADTYNNRVLIWNSIPTQNQQMPDVVLGQMDFNGNLYNRTGTQTIDGGSLNSPQGVFADGSHILVSDSSNDRVLVWNTLTPGNGQPADVVIGAKDFASSGSIGGPEGLQVEQGRLYVAESSASRVSVWNAIPTQNNIPATTVLGQSTGGNRPNMGGMIGISTLQRPFGMLVTDVGIYIADTGNGRIVAQPAIP